MGFNITEKLVVAVASSALFDLSESDKVFREKGYSIYKRYTKQHQNDVFKPGVAFPFVKRFLAINKRFPEQKPVEVVLLSKNDPETGLRVFNSISHYDLDIVRAGFLNGKSPIEYIPAFNTSLFLSANAEDVKEAVNAGFPAGTVLGESYEEDDPNENELRIAFDFDGVIVDDQAEKIFQEKDLDAFHDNEITKANLPMDPGPLFKLFKQLSALQRADKLSARKKPNSYKRFLRISIVTARSAPAHERAVNTLRKWRMEVDEAFFLGGIEKGRILEIMKPHIYFDDQMSHLKSSSGKHIPSVHIPFGITNR